MQTFDIIKAVRIHAGFWQLEVNGSLRPVYAGRQGRNWIVQGPSRRDAKSNDVHHGAFRTLADAKSMMNVVWWALDTERELARHDAQVEELRRLFRLARELKITFPMNVGGTDNDPIPLARQIAYVKARIEAQPRRVSA